MKILMLTPYLPYPPASGGQIRTLNLLKYLNRKHEITLISLYKSENEKKYASFLKSYCDRVYLCKRPEKPWQLKNMFKAVFSGLPFLIVRNYSSEARAQITQLLNTEKFDVIHAETFYIMPHIPQTEIPILLVEQTVEFQVYQHFISKFPKPLAIPFYLDIIKLKKWERFYWKKATLTAAVSQADCDVIQKVEPSIKPVIIPNGAGDEMFVEKLPPADFEKPILLFVGNFYWLQNVEAANFIINRLSQKIKEKLPHARIVIAGQQAKERLHQQSFDNVEIINVAADDTPMIQSLYHKATVFIAPIYGPGGTRLKILAAMASGLPVIATKTGLEGLHTTHMEHALIANNAEEFIEYIIQALSDRKLYEKLRENSYNLAREKFSWSAIAHLLEEVYEQVVTTAKSLKI